VYLSTRVNGSVVAGKDSLVVKIQGESPYKNTKKAVELLGGMKKFINKGDVVMVKPNIGWNRNVEQAANTNPEVVKALVEMVYKAGAKKVIVMDHTCNQAQRTYERSGIKEAAEKAGAEVRFVDENRLLKHNFKGEKVKIWPVYQDFLEVDKFISAPVLKHHASSEITIGMKNLYGILGGRRGKLHRNMGTGIADLAAGFKVDLTVVDATRVLLRNGPTGGSLDDVVMKKTIIASANIMEADVVATDLFGRKPQEIPFLVAAHKKGLGEIDLARINLKTVRI
jgi:uncharacterized protein (DUF362 family)